MSRSPRRASCVAGRTGHSASNTARHLSRNLHKNRWVGAILLAGGLTMISGGIWYAHDTITFLEATKRTHGTVLELKRERGVRGIRLDHPIVRFVVPETGRDQIFKSKIGLWPSPFDVGERVEVAYDPGNPKHAKINSLWTLWLPPVALTVFGLLCFGAGALTWKWTRKS
jgi:hypothetical protein